ncbi:glycosyltransferase involved in cell wall biosynthesis [Friedmanniella endophytica]|uniref:Glycosyltransferase involved in cell wall biosynthesis n=1 Tax=Microlunatus kandeliicorticis TaxID=1759536 RepID=A0A7W3P6S0_9ACTN|nr:glycosyltransferase family 4 protein [Microlunatus kandeliicorticis]MBA8795269.1 glycosyltransferase involved in cell wall biosynthesis [Microlunatus kandeliicorticis]
MRIAQVLTASEGGIGRHVADVTPRLVDLGHRVAIYCPRRTAAAQHFDRVGVPVRPLAALPLARGADVVHAHGYKAISLAAPLTRTLGPPLVGTWHNAVLAAGRAGQVGRALQRLSARAADLTLGASSDLVDLAAGLGARRARLGPVSAPATLAWLAYPPDEQREHTRAELGAGSARVVLSVGRLAAQKNYPMLLDVAARFRDRPGEAAVVFWVVGEGPERPALEARIAAEGLPVRLLGARDDVVALRYAADAFLLTSHWEARALVAQEALQHGLPFVGTAVGGVPELVGDAGLLVPPGDAEAAAAALTRVLGDPALADRLRTAGRARADAWPDGDAVALALELAYREVTRR